MTTRLQVFGRLYCIYFLNSQKLNKKLKFIHVKYLYIKKYFCQFIFHIFGVVRDEIIPLKVCGDQEEYDSAWSGDTVIRYCPDFSEKDFIHGDYYAEKASWYRLIIHTCDIEERKAMNKDCKNQTEIDEYFKKTIVGFDFINEKPGLLAFDNPRPLFENKRDMRYTVKPYAGYTMCHNVYLQKNQIELSDHKVGFYDEPAVYDYIDHMYSLNVFIKPYGNDYYNKEPHQNMLFYWNIILVHEGELNQRVRYTLIDILGEFGGVYQAVSLFTMVFFSIYSYKFHESVVF